MRAAGAEFPELTFRATGPKHEIGGDGSLTLPATGRRGGLLGPEGLGVDEFGDAEGAEFAAEAGVFDSAEGERGMG